MSLYELYNLYIILQICNLFKNSLRTILYNLYQEIRVRSIPVSFSW